VGKDSRRRREERRRSLGVEGIQGKAARKVVKMYLVSGGTSDVERLLSLFSL